MAVAGSETPGVTVRMWEALARPECLGDLVDWVREVALPGMERHPAHLASEAFASAGQQRVVIISRWRTVPGVPESGVPESGVPGVPGHLLARPAGHWDFTPIER